MKTNIKNISIAGLFTALIFIGAYIHINLPYGGYANLSDCMVILAASSLPMLFGIFSSVVGSVIADISLGFAHYAAASAIIKGIMALIVNIICRNKSKNLSSKHIIAAISAEIIMVLGYLGYEYIIIGYVGALYNILGNVLQGLISVVLSALFYTAIAKNSYLKKYFL